MTTPIDIRADHLRIVQDVLARHLPDGVKVWVFGSRATWATKDSSDLDLALEGKGEIPARSLSALETAFEDSDLPFEVDVVDLKRIHERFRGIVEQQRVSLPLIAAEKAILVDPKADARKDRRYTQWGDLVTLKYGRSLRRFKTGEARFRVFGTNGPIGWHDEALSEGASVIIGRKGAYRGIHYSPGPCFVIDTAFYLEPKVEMDVRWAYYTLLTCDISGLDSGSAIPSTRREDFYGLPVSVPSIAEQHAIVEILGTLDDKIELNRRMSTTLEATARALFESWFVNFDPVRAKSEGRDVELPKDVAELFPDRLVRSELGEIPEGWPLVPLPELMDVNPPRALRRGTVAPYLDMANMPTCGHAPATIVDRPFGSGKRFVNGDTLVARITPCLENGKTAYVDFLRDREIGWGSTEYIVMRPKHPLPSEFAYFLARSPRFRDFAIQNMSGTSGRQRVPATALSGFPISSPPPRVIAEFGRVAKRLLERARSAIDECRVLGKSRDVLLPKLVSGELPVREVGSLA